MSFSIELKLDKSSDIAAKTKELKRRVINLATDETLRNLKINTPVDKGRARGSWFMSNYSSDKTTIQSSVEYMKFLNDGTGIYGPSGRKIVSKNKKLLVFEYKGKKVYARSVKGIKPRKIVEKSIRETKKKIPSIGKIAARGI